MDTFKEPCKGTTILIIKAAPYIRTGVVFFKLFYPTAQMTTFLLPSEVR